MIARPYRLVSFTPHAIAAPVTGDDAGKTHRRAIDDDARPFAAPVTGNTDGKMPRPSPAHEFTAMLSHAENHQLE